MAKDKVLGIIALILGGGAAAFGFGKLIKKNSGTTADAPDMIEGECRDCSNDDPENQD